ncbi:MAG TPA: hypothetical protein VE442_12745 [Jatrophihabitans sp.]|jgi:hypothetical protein|nr:hypothetical protein [Jatrophihabitans sp.]
MSIATEIRTRTDNAVNQGKHVLDQAQAQLNDVTGQANEFYGKTRENVSEFATKAGTTVTDLRASAEKAINVEAIKTAVEPYVAHVKEYRTTVSDRAEHLLDTVKSDERVAKLVDAAHSFAGVVVEAVQDRVVKPVQHMTGRTAKPVTKRTTPAKSAPSAAAKPATKPAATKPATKPASKPAARKAPARKTPQS